MSEFIRAFLQQNTARGARSTALSPLGWLTAILVSAFLVALKYSAPAWVLVIVAIAFGASVLAYFTAYAYFMFKDPDALRSERFALSKMEIERSITGDSLRGFTEPGDARPRLLSMPEATESAEMEQD